MKAAMTCIHEFYIKQYKMWDKRHNDVLSLQTNDGAGHTKRSQIKPMVELNKTLTNRLVIPVLKYALKAIRVARALIEWYQLHSNSYSQSVNQNGFREVLFGVLFSGNDMRPSRIIEFMQHRQPLLHDLFSDAETLQSSERELNEREVIMRFLLLYNTHHRLGHCLREGMHILCSVSRSRRTLTHTKKKSVLARPRSKVHVAASTSGTAAETSPMCKKGAWG